MEMRRHEADAPQRGRNGTLNGALLHRGDAPHRSFSFSAGALFLDRVAEQHDELTVCVLGELQEREALDTLLGTSGKSDAALVAQAYLRFGSDALLRMRGNFSVMIWDASLGRLLLARAPTPLAPPLYLCRKDGYTRFSSSLEALEALEAPTPKGIDQEVALRWIETGLWPLLGGTPFSEIETVAPGEFASIARLGRTRKTSFWNFSPLPIPRVLDFEDARSELREALRAALSSVKNSTHIAATSPTHAALFEASPRGAQPLSFRPSFHDGALLEVAQACDQPLPLSRFAALAGQRSALARGGVQTLISDLGATATLGGTEGTIAAWLGALANALDAAPKPKTLLHVLLTGAPIDRHISSRPLARAITQNIRSVGLRWSKHVPGLQLTEPEAEEALFERVTPDPFTNRRFAETRDRALAAEAQTLSKLCAAHNAALFVPFLSAPIIELLFSIPPGHLLFGKRAMMLLPGGASISVLTAQPALPQLPFVEALAKQASTLGDGLGDSAGADKDRALGFALFLRAHG